MDSIWYFFWIADDRRGILKNLLKQPRRNHVYTCYTRNVVLQVAVCDRSWIDDQRQCDRWHPLYMQLLDESVACVDVANLWACPAYLRLSISINTMETGHFTPSWSRCLSVLIRYNWIDGYKCKWLYVRFSQRTQLEIIWDYVFWMIWWMMLWFFLELKSNFLFKFCFI